jgi:hypothetical protein
MTAPLQDPRLRDLAAKLFWWKGPAEALADQRRFLAQAMTFADWDDMLVVVDTYGEEALRTALTDAPPGVFDRRSWSYWHARLGVKPVPPLPRRRL